MADQDFASESRYVSLEDLKKGEKKEKEKKKSSILSIFKCCLPICGEREKKGILDDQMEAPVVTTAYGRRSR